MTIAGRAEATAQTTNEGAQPTEATRPPTWLGPAVLLALAPAAGYLLAYVHEAGFWSVFDAPTPVVVVDVQLVAGAVVALAVVGVSLLLIVNILYSVSRLLPDHSIIRALLPYFAAMAVLASAGYYLYPTEPQEWLWQIAVFVPFILITLVLPLVVRDVAGYSAKVAAFNEGEKRSSGVLSRIVRQAPVSVLALILGSVGALYLSYSVGRSSALNGSDYWAVTGSGARLVVLRHYGDDWLLAPLGHDGLYSGAIEILRVDTAKPLRLERVHLRPLVRDCAWFAGCHPAH